MNYLVMACKPVIARAPFEVYREECRNVFEANNLARDFRADGYAVSVLEPVTETLRKRVAP